MKVIRENLSEREFEEYCEDIKNRMEGTTYYGQQDEYVPYYGNLQRRHIYCEETDEEEVILYEEKYDEEKGEVLYDIYDEID